MISEFEMALLELHESMVMSEINFHLECATLYDDDILHEGVLYEDVKERFKKIKDTIRDMVYSFFDFINGALVTLCNKLRKIPSLAKTGLDLGKRGSEAKEKVSNYWKELKNTTSDKDYGEGKLNAIKSKIANIIAKFQKLCKDVSNKMKDFVAKTKYTGAMKSVGRSNELSDKYSDRAADSRTKAGETIYSKMADHQERKYDYARQRADKYVDYRMDLKRNR